MNIIQVGRPAVSRYHNHRKFYMSHQGIDYDVHDFPSAELGLKLGGFMALSDANQIGVYSDSDRDESDTSSSDIDVDEAVEPAVIVIQ